MITREEILMGRDKQYPLTPELEANLTKLIGAVNKFRAAYGKPLTVSSGYRPGAFNSAAGGAKASNHMICLAVDFKDADGAIDAFAVECDKKGLLKAWGLWLEHPDSTPGWCHLDIKLRGDRSSNIFKP